MKAVEYFAQVTQAATEDSPMYRANDLPSAGLLLKVIEENNGIITAIDGTGKEWILSKRYIHKCFDQDRAEAAFITERL